MKKEITYPYILTTPFGKVKIYRNQISGSHRYIVSWVNERGRQRTTYTEESQAHQRAEEILEDLKRGMALRRGITSEKAVMIEEYERMLATFGATIGDAVRHFVSVRSTELKSKVSVADAVEEYLAKFEDTRARHYKTVKSIMWSFKRHFHKTLDQVTVKELDAYFRALSKNGRTRNNHLGCLKTFFKWAQEWGGYLPKGDLEVNKIEPYPKSAVAISLFTPEETERLLQAAPDHLLPYLAIGAFAGVRCAEICRLDWGRHINLGDGFIELTSNITKTKRRRIAIMPDNLKAWLTNFKGEKEGPVVPRAHLLYKDRMGLCDTLKLAWKPNALRKGFISYRMAQPDADAAKVAKQCGNSPDMVEENYKELVNPTEAEKYFAIFPK